MRWWICDTFLSLQQPSAIPKFDGDHDTLMIFIANARISRAEKRETTVPDRFKLDQIEGRLTPAICVRTIFLLVIMPGMRLAKTAL
jgi:hypothetical protein